MQKFRRIAVTLVILYLLATSLLYFLQEKFIFLPTVLSHDYVYEFSEPFEEFNLETADGAKLNAIHFKREKPKGLILYFHGNAGDLSRWGTITSFFVRKGYDVIVMDYRSYGKSRGDLGEAQLFNDAQLFYDHALKSYAEQEIIVYGRSLGAAIATHVASKNSPGKLMLETPFYNLMDVAENRFRLLPVGALLKYRFESNKNIRTVKAPITIFHGTDDDVVAYESGRKLYDSIENTNKRFYTIEGGNHNNLIEFQAYQDAIDKELTDSSIK